MSKKLLSADASWADVLRWLDSYAIPTWIKADTWDSMPKKARLLFLRDLGEVFKARDEEYAAEEACRLARRKKGPLPLEIGKVYVNAGEYLGRMIFSIREDTVHYLDFGWPEASEIFNPVGQCYRGSFRKWAKRMLEELELEAAAFDAEMLLEQQREILTEARRVNCRRALRTAPVEELQNMLDRRLPKPKPQPPQPRTRVIDVAQE